VITNTEKETIVKYAKKYNIETIYLFGSSIEENSTANDIDLGIIGIQPGQFFKFMSELSKNLPKNIDIVDLSDKTLFNTMVKENGKIIYESTSKGV